MTAPWRTMRARASGERLAGSTAAELESMELASLAVGRGVVGLLLPLEAEGVDADGAVSCPPKVRLETD